MNAVELLKAKEKEFNILAQKLSLLREKNYFLKTKATEHQHAINTDEDQDQMYLFYQTVKLNLKEYKGIELQKILNDQSLVCPANIESIEIEDTQHEDMEESDCIAILNEINTDITVNDNSLSLKIQDLTSKQPAKDSKSQENNISRKRSLIQINTSQKDKNLDDLLRSMLSPKLQFSLPRIMRYVHKLQIMYEEKSEANDEIRDIPNVIIHEETEAESKIEFEPPRANVGSIYLFWTIKWHEDNLMFKHDVKLECSDNVMARFSQHPGFPILRGTDKLQHSDEIIEFIQSFMDD